MRGLRRHDDPKTPQKLPGDNPRRDLAQNMTFSINISQSNEANERAQNGNVSLQE